MAVIATKLASKHLVCRPRSFDIKMDSQPERDPANLLPPEVTSDDSSVNDDMPPLHRNNNRQVVTRQEIDGSSDSD